MRRTQTKSNSEQLNHWNETIWFLNITITIFLNLGEVLPLMVWLNLIMSPRKVTGEGGWDNIAQRKRLCFSTGGPGFDSQRLRNVNDVVEIYP